MRAESWLLSEVGNIVGGSIVDDGGGGGTFVSSVGSDIPCRIDALGGGEGEIASRLSDRSTHLVTLPAETVVSVSDDFAIDNRGTFEVTAVRTHSDELSRVIEVVPKT